VFTVTFVLYEKSGLDRPRRCATGATPTDRSWRRSLGCSATSSSTRWGAPEGDPPFLGVASLTFADQDAFGAAAATPEFAAAVADVDNFPDAQRLPTAFVEEVVIVG
jgi:uncharacterized protein (TIGR02118 family)